MWPSALRVSGSCTRDVAKGSEQVDPPVGLRAAEQLDSASRRSGRLYQCVFCDTTLDSTIRRAVRTFFIVASTLVVTQLSPQVPQHFEQQHRKRSITTWYCHSCPKIAPTVEDLLDHTRTSHPNVSTGMVRLFGANRSLPRSMCTPLKAKAKKRKATTPLVSSSSFPFPGLNFVAAGARGATCDLHALSAAFLLRRCDERALPRTLPAHPSASSREVSYVRDRVKPREGLSNSERRRLGFSCSSPSLTVVACEPTLRDPPC